MTHFETVTSVDGGVLRLESALGPNEEGEERVFLGDDVAVDEAGWLVDLSLRNAVGADLGLVVFR